jgi:hypothetical protein
MVPSSPTQSPPAAWLKPIRLDLGEAAVVTARAPDLIGADPLRCLLKVNGSTLVQSGALTPLSWATSCGVSGMTSASANRPPLQRRMESAPKSPPPASASNRACRLPFHLAGSTLRSRDPKHTKPPFVVRKSDVSGRSHCRAVASHPPWDPAARSFLPRVPETGHKQCCKKPRFHV